MVKIDDTFGDEIETEATEFFNQIFSELVSADNLINFLTQLKESDEKRNGKIFDCIVYNLLVEHDSFHKYSKTVLEKMSIFYGTLIKKGLISDLYLRVALRLILESILWPIETQMHNFGVRSFEIFVDRPFEWPNDCIHILQLVFTNDAASLATIKGELARISGTPHFDKQEPPEEVEYDIRFSFNQLTLENIEQLATKLNELEEQYYPWFAQDLIISRVTSEPNHIEKIVKLLDNVDLDPLNWQILQATYFNCKVLLKLKNLSSKQFSHLKALGLFLGQFTIGRNRGLSVRELDLESLVIQAYESGFMFFVIPFTSNVLTSCSSSVNGSAKFMHIFELLFKIKLMPKLRLSIQFDIDILFNKLGLDLSKVKPTCILKNRTMQVVDNPDFPDKKLGVVQRLESVYMDWCNRCERVEDGEYTNVYMEWSQSIPDILGGDDTICSFLRHIMKTRVSFVSIGHYAKLCFCILEFYGSWKLSLLQKLLELTAACIKVDSKHGKSVHLYVGLFENWLHDLCSLSDVSNFAVLTAFSDTFYCLRPSEVPEFWFSWLELVSHTDFMPKLLCENDQKGWIYFQRLLVDLFQFMESLMRNSELEGLVQLLHQNSVKVLLVIVQIVPEFLCDYYFSFCDVIPPKCIEMRNIVLSASPRNMLNTYPRILSEFDGALKAYDMENVLNGYIKTRQQRPAILDELRQKILFSPNESSRAGTRYNAPLINSLVLYLGIQAVTHAQLMPSGRPPDRFFVDIFKTFVLEVDKEGRIQFLNAMANHLRYPNSHTHYFSTILLLLFLESHQEEIKEQITRVLLERLLANDPPPWGISLTFSELTQDPRYYFWSWPFSEFYRPHIPNVLGTLETFTKS
ncbi:mRNA polyadenylation factor [Lithospermum erythrorhizon]|uniref:mRNA polyadenylation factor n=1 Tax=Lithospermum erythrorhizon TaxID=34254 RepID=A0AAV3NI42_LITER